MEVKKTIALNILPLSKRKREDVDHLISQYHAALVSVIENAPEKASTFRLQSMFYRRIRDEYGLHSQIANDLFKDAHAILSNGGVPYHVSVPFNIPRSGKLAETCRGNPIAVIAGVSGRIAIPIAQDGAYRRFKQHLDDGWRTTYFKFNGERLFVTLRRDVTLPSEVDAIVGVDIGSNTLAAISIINRDGRVLKQLYFGRDVAQRQRDINIRRAKLQSYAAKGERKAVRALRRLRGYERNFTTTRSYQIAHQIVDLAKQYNAAIAIEDLKGLHNRKRHRKVNRKVRRIPYARFQAALETVALQNGIPVVHIDPRNTSRMCSRCSQIGERSGGCFVCPHCGYEANADRNASVNIAIRAGLSFHSSTGPFFRAQNPDGNLAVNPGVFVHDGIGTYCSQHSVSSPRQAHGFIHG